MKKHTIIKSIIASGLLFAGAASASSTQDNETDLIYGNSSVVPGKSEAYIAGSSMQSDQSTDLIYGELKTKPSQGEAPEKFANTRDNNTDLIYGS